MYRSRTHHKQKYAEITQKPRERERFMLTEYTTPGTSVEVRDDETIYSLLKMCIRDSISSECKANGYL